MQYLQDIHVKCVQDLMMNMTQKIERGFVVLTGSCCFKCHKQLHSSAATPQHVEQPVAHHFTGAEVHGHVQPLKGDKSEVAVPMRNLKSLVKR